MHSKPIPLRRTFNKRYLDSLTHIVVGACIGELIAGKQLGRKALLLGALANSLPDIDIAASLFLSLPADLLAHRGFTHSILFALLVSPLLAAACARIFHRDHFTFKQWWFFWCLQILTHLFIDSFNSYGTGLFEPFSHARISFNTLFVADPLITLWPLIAFVLLFILKKSNTRRKLVARFALILSGTYLLTAVLCKWSVDKAVANDLERRHIAHQKYFTTPTPLNDLLWYVVVQNDSGYAIGYRSVFDKPDSIQYHSVPRNSGLMLPHADDKDMRRLIRFSPGYYAAAMWHDTLVFNDIRFGEIAGWAEPQPKFVFYYFIQHPEANDRVVQRGRFAKWDKQQLASFVRRIEGE